MIRVTVWNEFYHETISEEIRAIYPQGIHQAIADFLGKNEDMTVRTVVMDDPENGLTDEILESTDVLLWWSHVCHEKVSDLVAEKVKNRVLKGMGFIPLHSSHMCKPFRLLMGTGCTLKWREGDKERLWCCNPGHPIAEGIPESFTLEPEEMYGEHFDIPTPDDVIYISWFKGGDPDVPLPGAMVRFFISAQDTNLIRHFIMKMYKKYLQMPFAGHSRVIKGLRLTAHLYSLRSNKNVNYPALCTA